MPDPARVLLVEDDLVITAIIENILLAEGYQVVSSEDGQAAWDLLCRDAAFDLILLDRQMPRMDGMALLRAIKRSPGLEHIPVIMETAMQDHENIREGLDAGAYYYLTKPFQPEVLVAVVRAALQQVVEYRRLRESVQVAERPFSFLREGVFQFRSLEEGRQLAGILALACPDPERSINGLQELLINAVEHGNLGMTYREKSDLLLAGAWEEELERRLGLPEYRLRQVEVVYARRPDQISFVIRDQGKGFDCSDYLDFSPERAFDLHGRGIAMARKLSFDSLEYQGNGNTVMAIIRLAEKPLTDTR
jgi:CheY-like chemotaxis protein